MFVFVPALRQPFCYTVIGQHQEKLFSVLMAASKLQTNDRRAQEQYISDLRVGYPQGSEGYAKRGTAVLLRSASGSD